AHPVPPSRLARLGRPVLPFHRGAPRLQEGQGGRSCRLRHCSQSIGGQSPMPLAKLYVLPSLLLSPASCLVESAPERAGAFSRTGHAVNPSTDYPTRAKNTSRVARTNANDAPVYFDCRPGSADPSSLP